LEIGYSLRSLRFPASENRKSFNIINYIGSSLPTQPFSHPPLASPLRSCIFRRLLAGAAG
jgi:hypothetical protein